MPLQNRVDPFGELFADSSRGLFFGNRGGKFHRDNRTLASRRHVSRAWICCVLAFKGRQRDVWGRYYTELFFMDEPTALAAGHRPCFECRRADATDFAERFGGGKVRPSAGKMDEKLHAERLDGRAKRFHRRKLSELADGVFVTLSGSDAFAVKGRRLLRWSSSGYAESVPFPSRVDVDMLTPPSVAQVLARGYRPHWHPSAASL
jgi:hypothetical protein